MRPRLAAVLAAAAAMLLSGCPAADSPAEEGSGEEDAGTTVALDPPEVGACRMLGPEDVAEPSDETEPVPCSEEHTAETFLVASFPRKGFADAAYDASRLGAHVHQRCARQFRKFTGADESLALRSVLSWAWFRPTEEQWDSGARWFRCDVLGGDENSVELMPLPRTAKGALLGIPGDRWIACVDAEDVAGAPRVPCTQEHVWRAVTTIVVGKQKEKYPGDRLVQVISRDFCSDSVGAWLNYPLDYEYAYTWFHRNEWQAGNRRSICWARTEK